MTDVATFAAQHALLLLAGATLGCAAAAALVMSAAHLARRHADRLWTLVDGLVPGRGLRTRTYLLFHVGLGLVLVLGVVALIALMRDVSASSAGSQGASRLVEFDVAFATALRMHVDPTWRSLFWNFTWLGSYAPLTVATAAGVWRLITRGRRLLAIMWGASQLGGLAISEALKLTVARARPEGADPELVGRSLSFPSGHAVASVVFCGVGAYILMKTIDSPWRRFLLVSLALAWCLAMGFSRLYLGVHYLSDILAGFVVGAAWVAVCLSGMEAAFYGRLDSKARAGVPAIGDSPTLGETIRRIDR